MANDVSTVKSRGGIIAKMAAGFLSDHVQFVKTIDKADPSDFEGRNGYSAGDTVKISIPAQFTLGTGSDITSTIQDVEEGSVNLTVNNQYNVPIAFTSAEIATDIGLKSWSQRILKPAMITLGNNIEKACLQQAAQATYNLVGTPGSTTFNNTTILSSGQKIDESGCEDYGNRFVLLNPAATVSAVTSRASGFNDSGEISKQYKQGAMGTADGFTYLRNNLIYSHTNGNDVTGVLVNSASVASGDSTLPIDGVTNTTGTIKKGQVFTIAGVNKVHPVTKVDLGIPQQFVFTADATANGSGQITAAISPTLYSTGSKQNVSALPADNAALTFVGAASTSYAQNLAYHKSAFRFVSLPLVKPDDVDMVSESTKDGITVRIIRAYDPLKDRMIFRADVLWGMANVRPSWACRITS